MRVTFLKSAGVLIESGDVRLLCDPWLKDGAYHGAWAHVPPCNVTPEEIGTPSGIYISHIHPDHLHAESLSRFPRGTPVFIHRYAWPHLADYIKALGFTPTEIPNGEDFHLGGNLRLAIYAADNCDPALCGRVFGCDARVGAERPGSVQIDSLAVVTDGKHTLVNVNDCPFSLAGPALQTILGKYGRPDFLLTNYVGAGPYPQCFASLSAVQKMNRAEAKAEQFLNQAQRYVEALQPRAFTPFAGTYTLAGKLAALNPYRGTPSLSEAARILAARIKESRCVHLETRQTYDLGTGEISGEPEVWTAEQTAAYERDVLSVRLLEYETEPDPKNLTYALQDAARRFQTRCEAVGFKSPTRVYVGIEPDACFYLPIYWGKPQIVARSRALHESRHLIISADRRLIKWLLDGPEGPHRAHWEEASIGSHLTFERSPDVYERGLYFCLNECYA